jgi:hypothetical protein
MRSLALLTLPVLALAAPPTSPTITRLVFSGSGCPNDSGSVRSDTATLSDNAGVSFTQLKGDSTDNCAVHIQSSGASAGWQVAVREIDYIGDVNLRGNSELDTYTQVFWSENAGNTVRLQMKKREAKLTNNTGHTDRWSNLRRARDQRLRHSAQQHGGPQMVEMHRRRWKPGHLEYQLPACYPGRFRDVRLQACELEV